MSRFKKVTLIFGLLWLMAAGGAVVWARDPIPMVPNPDCADPVTCPPTRPVRYTQEVFKPAIESQDVNLQSTVFEIFLSLIASMRRAIVQDKCDATCQADLNKWINENPNDPRILATQQNRYGGLLPELTKMSVAMATQPPVSSVEYVVYVRERLHLTSPAYAQGTAGQIGFGYEGLAPIRGIWTAFRNMAYLLATIGFVVMSFLIMFRVKIGSQTVIGVQQALSKLIVSFLAVTFSYAIAGLMVDLAFVMSFVVITFFTSANLIPGSPTPAELQRTLFSGNILHSATSLVSVAGNLGGILDQIFKELFGMVAGSGGVVDTINRFFSGMASEIGTLIVAIALIYSLFKLLFQLASTFVEILFLAILGPLYVLYDWSGWLRRLFANVAVFPVVTFTLLLGMALVGDGGTQGLNIANQGLKMPYLALGSEWITPFLAIIVLTMLPEMVKNTKSAFKVASMPTSAVGVALGYGLGRTQALGNAAWGGVSAPFAAGGRGVRSASNFAMTPIRSAFKTGQEQLGQELYGYASTNILPKIPGVRRLVPKPTPSGTAVKQGQQEQKNLESTEHLG